MKIKGHINTSLFVTGLILGSIAFFGFVLWPHEYRVLPISSSTDTQNTPLISWAESNPLYSKSTRHLIGSATQRPNHRYTHTGQSLRQRAPWNGFQTNKLHAKNVQFRGISTYAAGRNTSERSGSCRSTMNFAKIWSWVLSRRNSGRLWRSAMVTTRSDGARPGRIVRSQEPNERQTSS